VPNPGVGNVSRFEIQQDETPKPGDVIDPRSMAYKVGY
jgi:hypothetical protein